MASWIRRLHLEPPGIYERLAESLRADVLHSRLSYRFDQGEGTRVLRFESGCPASDSDIGQNRNIDLVVAMDADEQAVRERVQRLAGALKGAGHAARTSPRGEDGPLDPPVGHWDPAPLLEWE